ncbi:MAG: hypothetical protein P8Q97_09125 [Myxococcota bacterium]|nr:hypothetical protein [Myxococcota bacterium]
MIFDHYTSQNPRETSYLIACPDSREAAIVNPLAGAMAAYQATLVSRELRLTHILLTNLEPEARATAEKLSGMTNSSQIFPSLPTAPLADSQASSLPGRDVNLSDEPIAIGRLRIEAQPTLAGSESKIVYQVGDYTLTAESLLIGAPETSPIATDNGPAISQFMIPSEPARKPVQNFRKDRLEASIEVILLEDLHSSLIEDAFSPKETLVVRAYIELLEENELAHPSAAELGNKIGNIDRSVIHVLVHSIRWKQIGLDRLPLVLAGQASKWLRSLKTEPEFTSHEEEFLVAYLKLVADTGTPPSGPDIAGALGSRRSIQWVRKRAFTIRRKQREFGCPLLILSRNKPSLPQFSRPVQVMREHAPIAFEHAPIA